MAIPVCIYGLILLASAPSLAEASAFLGTEHAAAAADDGASARLLEAINAALAGGGAAREARVAGIERLLAPTFAALPKTPQGSVGAAAARYALHRLFVQRHGWQVKGLEPAGGSWDAASPIDVLGNRVPDHLSGLLEEHLGARGFSLGELAVFAAAIEGLVHGEAGSRLKSVADVLGYQGSAQLSEEEARRLIDSYMALYIVGANFTSLTTADVRKQIAAIHEEYPSWPETQKWLGEVREELMPGEKSFTLRGLETVVESVGERYGRWQSRECSALKQTLLSLEESNGTGRVRLGDFYSSAMHDGNWQFSESAAYLRQLGALDDSDPSSLKVIIPNYLNGPSNCIAASAFYAVCCIDECEDLLSYLESKLGASTATPTEIATLVAALPSASLPGSRSLPTALLRRLDEVAEHHGGRVPLHGRLFAQWMHHAYPRECPYPHVSGTTAPRRADEWEAETGTSVAASREEMQGLIEIGQQSRRAQSNHEEGLCSAMWTMEEELVVTQQGAQPGAAAPDGAAGSGRAAMRGLALAGAAGALVLTLIKTLGPVLADASAGPKGSSRDVQMQKIYAV